MITVLANGCFDLFHYGHLKHLEEASNMGDRLIVSITSDKFVNKPGKPVFPDYERQAIVHALRFVDQAIIVDGLMQAMKQVAPDIVVKGIDYGQLDKEHYDYCLRHNIQMRFTGTPKMSSTEIINGLKRG